MTLPRVALLLGFEGGQRPHLCYCSLVAGPNEIEEAGPHQSDAQSYEERAAIRRATYSGEVVVAGTPKPRLRDFDPTEQRLIEMWTHCKAQWLASGRAMPVPCDRANLPGEVFRCDNET